MLKEIARKWEKLKWIYKDKKIEEKTQAFEFKILHSKKGVSSHPSAIQIPHNNFVNFFSYLTQFYNSTSQNGRVNGEQLAFVTGFPGAGKTTLLRESIKKYKLKKNHLNSQKNQSKREQFGTLSTPEYIEAVQRENSVDHKYFLPILVDYQHETQMSPHAFFHHFQNKLLNSILECCDQEGMKDYLNQKIILQIVLSSHSPEYIFVYLKDTLNSILTSHDILHLHCDENIKRLQDINQKIIQMKDSEFFESQLYSLIIETIREDRKLNKLEASIRLFLSIFSRVEYENRPLLFQNTWYQTGIQTTRFLFDILNYICGFGELNQQLLRNAIMKERGHLHDIAFKSQQIVKTSHVDVVIVLCHLENISCFQHPLFVQWLDALLIRVQNHSNLRKHFPLIIEFDSSETLKRLQKMGRFLVDIPTVLEVPGYFLTTMHQNSLPLIFNQNAIQKLLPVLGRNPSLWNTAIRKLAQGVSIQEILVREAPFMKNPSINFFFQAKINRLFIDPENLPLIDNNTLRHQIRYLMKALRRCNGFFSTQHVYNNLWLFENPAFSSLWGREGGENVFFSHYYYFAAELVDHRYMRAISDQIKGKRSLQEKISYLRWYWFGEGLRFRYRKRQLNYMHDYELERFKRVNYLARRSDFHLQEYYFGFINEYRITRYEGELRQKYII